MLLSIELMSAVTLSLSVGALVDGICAMDWRDFGLFGLVDGGPIATGQILQTLSVLRSSLDLQHAEQHDLYKLISMSKMADLALRTASQKAWRKQRRKH